MAEINVPTWLEDPTPAFNVIKMGLEKGIDYNLDEERKKIEAERMATEKEVLEKIAPEQRGWFTDDPETRAEQRLVQRRA